MAHVKCRVGDVFEVPIDDDHVGHGQVLANIRPNPLFMAIFEPLHDRVRVPVIQEIVREPIVFLANSLDSKIWHGHWKVIGNEPVDLSHIPFPSFKVSVDAADEIYVISYDGQTRRRATAAEEATLPFRTTVAPIRLENALKAHHGLIPWHPDFDPLLLGNVKACVIL